MSSKTTSAAYRTWASADHTLVEVALVEVVWARNIHIVETCYLYGCDEYSSGVSCDDEYRK